MVAGYTVSYFITNICKCICIYIVSIDGCYEVRTYVQYTVATHVTEYVATMLAMTMHIQ